MFVKYFSKDDLWETFPGSKGVVLAMGEKMLMYYIEYDPQRTFPEHSHPHEQVGYCVSGEGEIGIGDEVIRVLPGCGYYVPSNIKHYEKNTGNEPFICVDIFSPVRDDLATSAFRRDYFTKSKGPK
jgi:quercetin dioxygenase-like cupin family protein